MNNIVYWREISDANFMYGSRVNVAPDHVVTFANELMAPGVTIMEWSSKYNYQMRRRIPQLPNLNGGQKYYLYANFTTERATDLIVEVTYYNELGEKIGNDTIRGKRGRMNVPEGFDYYKIALLNGGVTQFTFYWLQITDNEDSLLDKDGFEVMEDHSQETEVLNVVFLEPQRSRLVHLAEKYHYALGTAGNVVAIGTLKLTAHAYRSRVLNKLLQNYNSNYKRLNLIGYGPIGNDASQTYAKMFENATAYPLRPTPVAADLTWLQPCFDDQATLMKLPFIRKGGEQD